MCFLSLERLWRIGLRPSMVLLVPYPESISHLPDNGTLILFLPTTCPVKTLTPPGLLELLVTIWSSSGQRDVGRSPEEGSSTTNKQTNQNPNKSLCLPASSCVNYGCNVWCCRSSLVTMRTKVSCWNKESGTRMTSLSSCTSPGLPNLGLLARWLK